ncbi:AMP-binding protein, partial [candidate division KSB1 bacterium]|nr:AMP-binding protein [candidate division KSB1 bacterium]
DPAVVYFGRAISYQELYDQVRRFRKSLKEIGVKKGDQVVFLLPNIPQFVIAYWAVLSLGGVVVLMNPLLSEREIEYQFSHLRISVVLTLDRLYSKIRPLLRKQFEFQSIITSAELYMPILWQVASHLKSPHLTVNRHQNLYKFKKMISNAMDEFESVAKPGDIAVLIYTGGVTGKPKAACLSHRNLLANALQERAWMVNLQLGQEKVLGLVPLIHSYGLTVCLHFSLVLESSLVLVPRFQSRRLYKILMNQRITIFPAVPTIFTALLRHVSEEQKLSFIKACFSGGSPLDVSLQARFQEKFGCRVIQGFGLTETSPITHANPVMGKIKLGSVGLPWPNTQARIVDLDTRQELGIDQIGELEIKGPQVMLGYWPLKEDEKIEWFQTGDIAKMDKDGYFFIVDRKKDVILSGGYNIYPSEVESVLLEHPAVNQVAVVGMPDEYYGERVKAFIVPTKDVSDKALIQHCRHRLAAYKVPKEIEFRSSFPRNLLGKVLRRQLIHEPK